MKKSKAVLLFFLFSPVTALAHGEEVLITLFFEFVVVAIFITWLLIVKLRAIGKLIIGAIYILTTVLAFAAVDRLPYNDYRTVINIAIVAIPATIVGFSYMMLRNKFQKKIESAHSNANPEP